MRPLKDKSTLNKRLDAVAFFTNVRNLEALSGVQSCLKHVKNIAVCRSSRQHTAARFLSPDTFDRVSSSLFRLTHCKLFIIIFFVNCSQFLVE